MLLYILLVVAALATIVAIIWGTRDDGFGYGVFVGFITLMGSAMGLLLIFVLLLVLPIWHNVKVSDTTTQRNLTSLHVQQQGELSGRFYLGAGTVSGKSEPAYTYMYQAKDNTGATYYKLATVSTELSRVYETDSATPKVIKRVQVVERRNDFILPFASLVGTQTQYSFQVPTGSVVQNYQAN